MAYQSLKHVINLADEGGRSECDKLSHRQSSSIYRTFCHAGQLTTALQTLSLLKSIVCHQYANSVYDICVLCYVVLCLR